MSGADSEPRAEASSSTSGASLLDRLQGLRDGKFTSPSTRNLAIHALRQDPPIRPPEDSSASAARRLYRPPHARRDESASSSSSPTVASAAPVTAPSTNDGTTPERTSEGATGSPAHREVLNTPPKSSEDELASRDPITSGSVPSSRLSYSDITRRGCKSSATPPRSSAASTSDAATRSPTVEKTVTGATATEATSEGATSKVVEEVVPSTENRAASDMMNEPPVAGPSTETSPTKEAAHSKVAKSPAVVRTAGALLSGPPAVVAPPGLQENKEQRKSSPDEQERRGTTTPTSSTQRHKKKGSNSSESRAIPPAATANDAGNDPVDARAPAGRGIANQATDANTMSPTSQTGSSTTPFRGTGSNRSNGGPSAGSSNANPWVWNQRHPGAGNSFANNSGGMHFQQQSMGGTQTGNPGVYGSFMMFSPPPNGSVPSNGMYYPFNGMGGSGTNPPNLASHSGFPMMGTMPMDVNGMDAASASAIALNMMAGVPMSGGMYNSPMTNNGGANNGSNSNGAYRGNTAPGTPSNPPQQNPSHGVGVQSSNYHAGSSSMMHSVSTGSNSGNAGGYYATPKNPGQGSTGSRAATPADVPSTGATPLSSTAPPMASAGTGGSTANANVSMQGNDWHAQMAAYSLYNPVDFLTALPHYIDGCLRPGESDRAKRESLFRRLQAVARSCCGVQAELRVHGSVTTGLALAWSDIDLLVVGYQPMSPIDALNKMSAELLEVDDTMLAEIQQRQDIVLEASAAHRELRDCARTALGEGQADEEDASSSCSTKDQAESTGAEGKARKSTSRSASATAPDGGEGEATGHDAYLHDVAKELNLLHPQSTNVDPNVTPATVRNSVDKEQYPTQEDLEAAETVFRGQIERDYSFSTPGDLAVALSSSLDAGMVPHILTSSRSLDHPANRSGEREGSGAKQDENKETLPTATEGGVSKIQTEEHSGEPLNYPSADPATTTQTRSVEDDVQSHFLQQKQHHMPHVMDIPKLPSYMKYIPTLEGPLFYVQTIISTRVPVIKVTDKVTGLKADITFAGGDHWHSMQLTKSLLQVFPQAQPLILFLKHVVRGMLIGENEPGGVSSFVIYLLVRHFFNEYSKMIRRCVMSTFERPAGESEPLSPSGPPPHEPTAEPSTATAQDAPTSAAAIPSYALVSAEKKLESVVGTTALPNEYGSSENSPTSLHSTSRENRQAMEMIEKQLNLCFHALQQAKLKESSTTSTAEISVQPITASVISFLCMDQHLEDESVSNGTSAFPATNAEHNSAPGVLTMLEVVGPQPSAFAAVTSQTAEATTADGRDRSVGVGERGSEPNAPPPPTSTTGAATPDGPSMGPACPTEEELDRIVLNIVKHHAPLQHCFWQFCHYYGCVFNYETEGIHFEPDGSSSVVVKPYRCARRGQYFHMTSPFDPEYDLTARMTCMREFQWFCNWFDVNAQPDAPQCCTMQYVVQWLSPLTVDQDMLIIHHCMRRSQEMHAYLMEMSAAANNFMVQQREIDDGTDGTSHTPAMGETSRPMELQGQRPHRNTGQRIEYPQEAELLQYQRRPHAGRTDLSPPSSNASVTHRSVGTSSKMHNASESTLGSNSPCDAPGGHATTSAADFSGNTSTPVSPAFRTSASSPKERRTKVTAEEIQAPTENEEVLCPEEAPYYFHVRPNSNERRSSAAMMEGGSHRRNPEQHEERSGGTHCSHCSSSSGGSRGNMPLHDARSTSTLLSVPQLADSETPLPIYDMSNANNGNPSSSSAAQTYAMRLKASSAPTGEYLPDAHSTSSNDKQIATPSRHQQQPATMPSTPPNAAPLAGYSQQQYSHNGQQQMMFPQHAMWTNAQQQHYGRGPISSYPMGNGYSYGAGGYNPSQHNMNHMQYYNNNNGGMPQGQQQGGSSLSMPNQAAAMVQSYMTSGNGAAYYHNNASNAPPSNGGNHSAGSNANNSTTDTNGAVLNGSMQQQQQQQMGQYMGSVHSGQNYSGSNPPQHHQQQQQVGQHMAPPHGAMNHPTANHHTANTMTSNQASGAVQQQAQQQPMFPMFPNYGSYEYYQQQYQMWNNYQQQNFNAAMTRGPYGQGMMMPLQSNQTAFYDPNMMQAGSFPYQPSNTVINSNHNSDYANSGNSWSTNANSTGQAPYSPPTQVAQPQQPVQSPVGASPAHPRNYPQEVKTVEANDYVQESEAPPLSAEASAAVIERTPSEDGMTNEQHDETPPHMEPFEDPANCVASAEQPVVETGLLESTGALLNEGMDENVKTDAADDKRTEE